MANGRIPRRSRIGCVMHLVNAQLPVSSLLEKMASKIGDENLKRSTKSPKQIGRIKIPDAVIAEIRISNEVNRLTYKEIFEKYKDVCEKSYLRKILEYEVRKSVTIGIEYAKKHGNQDPGRDG